MSTVSIDLAISFAAMAHAGQTKKYDGLPYITHPIEVMKILHDHGIRDPAMLVAAVLHDVVEDTPVGLPTIWRRFGDDVAKLVDELTDQFPAGTGGNRRERKEKERARVATTSPRAQTIKYADLISNTLSIVRGDPGFARVYLEEKRLILLAARAGDDSLWQLAWKALGEGQLALVHHHLSEM